MSLVIGFLSLSGYQIIEFSYCNYEQKVLAKFRGA